MGKYKLSKVITLSPRYLIRNNLQEAICYREHGVAPRGRSTLEPSERIAFHSLRSSHPGFLTVAFPGLNTQWSAFNDFSTNVLMTDFLCYTRSPPISMEDIGSVHFRLKKPGDNGSTHLIRADVQMDGSTIFVFIHLADDDWPFLIENDSSFAISFWQMVSRRNYVAIQDFLVIQVDIRIRRTVTQISPNPKQSTISQSIASPNMPGTSPRPETRGYYSPSTMLDVQLISWK